MSILVFHAHLFRVSEKSRIIGKNEIPKPNLVASNEFESALRKYIVIRDFSDILYIDQVVPEKMTLLS